MWRGIGALLLMLLLLSSNVCAQTDTLLYPLKNVPLLSGNFGELRATHFHSGIDIRTGGVEGLPVVCVKDGKIVRSGVHEPDNECRIKFGDIHQTDGIQIKGGLAFTCNRLRFHWSYEDNGIFKCRVGLCFLILTGSSKRQE